MAHAGPVHGWLFLFFCFFLSFYIFVKFHREGEKGKFYKANRVSPKKKRKNLIKRAINFEKTKFRRKRRKRNISNFPKTIKFKKKN